MPSKAVTATSVSDNPQEYEAEHVHAVYDEIAPHFSSTRYKPWPIIAQFLSSIPPGWVGLDSGTGNGKYLPLPVERPGSMWTVGLDRSRNLLDIARTAGGVHREVVWGDVLGRPWRDGAFDYAISIATIHHLATHARRKAAVQRLVQCLSHDHGRALIYVWAIEQDELSKRSIPLQAHAEQATQLSANGSGQDVFVPWVLSTQSKPSQKSNPAPAEDQRASNEIASRTVQNAEEAAPKVYNRYYHMFAKGELSELVIEAARESGLHVGSRPTNVGPNKEVPRRGIEIVQDGWERSNYYVELRCWRI
ncbi:S-adenosyl-L-methionine-dependent methyltransferase [Obba rivulosa]|uniref:S-adenosyl-L-methionine-dependent methyltransferase n=1 Tax=Obba rivulosa TaxID=1052685 RepID=A0A8E2DSF9_9APHY|nr:S-adenosyl-L-methionine-dependent methyltransferase [Obba rivulosa]